MRRFRKKKKKKYAKRKRFPKRLVKSLNEIAIKEGERIYRYLYVSFKCRDRIAAPVVLLFRWFLWKRATELIRPRTSKSERNRNPVSLPPPSSAMKSPWDDGVESSRILFSRCENNSINCTKTTDSGKNDEICDRHEVHTLCRSRNRDASKSSSPVPAVIEFERVQEWVSGEKNSRNRLFYTCLHTLEKNRSDRIGSGGDNRA